MTRYTPTRSKFLKGKGKGKAEGKGAYICAPLRSESSQQKRSGMARVLKGFHSPAVIRTCNLPIANPALYHTATSASVVVVVVVVVPIVVVSVL